MLGHKGIFDFLLFCMLCTTPTLRIYAANVYSSTSGNIRNVPNFVLSLPQQQKYFTQNPLQQNGYPYDALGTSSFPENGRNQRYSYNYAFPQPTSFTQSQLPLSREQLQQPQRQQQSSPFWIRRPIVVDYNTPERYNIPTIPAGNAGGYASNPEYQPTREILRNNLRQRTQQNLTPFTSSYADEGFYSPHNIENPNSYRLNSFAETSLPARANHYGATEATDYATLFERYLRKYPKRLQPSFTGYGRDLRER